MAFNVNFGDKYFVFIFILLCTETRIFAFEDDVAYKVDVGEEYGNFQDISVIEYHDRQRRQTDAEAANTNGSTTSAPPPKTTTPDKGSWNVMHDDHRYYKSQMFVPIDITGYWVELTDVAGHSTLSDSHRTAVTAKLPFKFPFYGHLIDNVTIATGGFLYMSPFIHKFLTATQYIAPLMANFDTKSGGKGSTVLYTNVGFLYMSPFSHQWLTATQYIAPLMANFDTTLGNSSEVLYVSMGSKFVVEWRDVHLQDQKGTGAFRFQTVLHRNGSITFAYRRLPIPIGNISTSSHPVKIGLSDAFYFDSTTFGTKRRTINEYHRVVLNTTYIQEGTIVLINPQPNDVAYKVDVGEEYGNFQDISVMEYHDRQRRQTDAEAANTNGSTTAAPPPKTTTPDRGSWNVMHDDHRYYKSQMFVPIDITGYWVELTDVAGHSTLSDSHRTAVTAKLPFKFPFYGHRIDNVTIATGGFLYMSPFIHKFLTATQYIAPLMANFDTKSGGKGSTVLYTNVGFLYMSPFLHQWLTATQYIAPLMANFDTTLGNSSEVLYVSMGSKFVVEWRDVHLQDQNGTGAFRFQTVLHRNGSITFAYRRLPIPIGNISTSSHPVKIGLSDAFYFDSTTFGTKRRTIYEYHRVVLNTTYIQEGTIVLINPQPTCNQYTDCESCVSSKILFECRWCGIINKCSDSVDWHRQKWLNAGCVHLSGKSNCSSIPVSSPKPQTSADAGTKIAVIVIVVVIVVALIGSIVGWVFYAYTHPTSASGMWLMEHRPSQMKAKMSNMKFWKRNGTAGDKYAVESTA